MRNVNAVVVSLGLALSGCGWWSTSSGRLSVTPSVVCAGTEVTVEWSHGTASTTVVAGGAVIGSGVSGTTRYTPTASGRVELRGASTVRADVEVTSGGPRSAFLPVTTCGPLVALGGLWGLYGAGRVIPGRVDARLHADTVRMSRVGFVSHAGVTSWFETFPVPLSGSMDQPFEFAVPLLGHESCGAVGAAAPAGVVLVEAQTSCR